MPKPTKWREPTVGRPRLNPTVPYAETNSKASRDSSMAMETLRPDTLTNGEDIEPAVIRRVGQTRTLMVPLVLQGWGKHTNQMLTSMMHTTNKAKPNHHMSKARLQFKFANPGNAYQMKAAFACAKSSIGSIPLQSTQRVRSAHLPNHLLPRTHPTNFPRIHSSSGHSWQSGLGRLSETVPPKRKRTHRR